MTDTDAGRDFKGLDAREAQEALAEELAEELTEHVSNKEELTSADATRVDLDEAETQDVSADDERAEAETEVEAFEESLDEEALEAAQCASDEVDAADQERSVDEEGEQGAADTEMQDADDGASQDAAKDEENARPADEDQDADESAPPPEWSEEDQVEQTRMLEALLFAAAEPLDPKSMADRLPAGADVPALIERVKSHYEGRGVVLAAIDGKWRFVTAIDVAHVLQKEKSTQRKLSRAALETLAIIAYHQPCTRADIEDVRGVQVAKGSLDQLLEIGWVKMRGKRRDVPGRPTLYGTTQDFLEHFGLEAIADLPGLADLKAAGMLDARLPPGFSVPTPVDGDDDEEADDEGEAGEFAQDFLEEEADEMADA